MSKLEKDAVLETWGTLVPNQAGRYEDAYKMAVQHIQAVISGGRSGPWKTITVERKEVAGMGGLAGALSAKRDRLIARWENYKIYVCFRPYGTDLDASWNLTFEPGLLTKLSGIDLSSLNAFQVEDLRAFTTLVHRGVTTAVDTVMQEAGLDSSKVNKTSKGFLGVS